MPSSSSVTTWLAHLKAGDAAAAEPLWKRYFAQLVELANQHLSRSVRAAGDGEDVAASAFADFCAGVRAGRFPHLADRNDLWRLLLTITLRRARNLARHETADRRDSRRTVRAADLFELPDADLDRLAGDAPEPALALEVADQLRFLLDALPGDDLRCVARDVLAGYTTVETAGRLGCGLRTVERRLQRIRQFWEPFVAGSPSEA
jgi:DNA-directed RNA polymerase specialized sigma24 family protein